MYLLIRTRLDEAETAAYKLRTRQLVAASSADGIILSYPKSGRTWVETMLSHLYTRRFGLAKTRVLDFQEDRTQFTELPFFFFTHDYAHVTGGRWLIPMRRRRRHFHVTPTVMIVRDPIDIAVSMYFQLTRREGHLNGIDLYDFVKSGQGGLVTIVEFMNFWARELPSIHRHLIIRYEDLFTSPLEKFGEIVHFFGLEFDPEDVQAAVEFARFENLQELEKAGELSDWRFSAGAENDEDHLKVRRGKIGGYHDYFSGEQCADLEKFVNATLDPVYGYGRAFRVEFCAGMVGLEGLEPPT